MSSPQFEVKALYDYSSEYDDDLNFSAGTIINVTNIEDAEWYSGNYTDPSTGKTLSGIFPQNFVERYEDSPEKPESEISEKEDVPKQEEAVEKEPEIKKPTPQAVEPKISKEDVESAESAVPEVEAVLSSAQHAEEKSNTAGRSAILDHESTSSLPSKHKNALFNKIAAFNTPEAAPILPSSKKLDDKATKRQSFVGVPSSYIPPSFGPKKTSTFDSISSNDIISSDEVPFKESHASPEPEDIGEEVKPKLSLKERIALLQKTQQEEAEREAALMKKRAEKKKLKKNQEEVAHANISRSTTAVENDVKQVYNDESLSKEVNPEQEEIKPVSNDSDEYVHVKPDSQVEPDEDASGEFNMVDSTEEQQEKPDDEHEVEDNGDEDEDEDEDESEEDEEEMRKRQLRERMAKLSGGAGMFGMMGMSPFGGASPARKKKSKPSHTEQFKSEEPDDEFANMPKAVPILPMAVSSPLPKSLENMGSSVDSVGESSSHVSEIRDDIDIESFNKDLEKDAKEESFEQDLNKSINIGYSEDDDESENITIEQTEAKKSQSPEDDAAFFDIDDGSKQQQQLGDEKPGFTEANASDGALAEEDQEVTGDINDHISLIEDQQPIDEPYETEHIIAHRKAPPPAPPSGSTQEHFNEPEVIHSAPPLPPHLSAPPLPPQNNAPPLPPHSVAPPLPLSEPEIDAPRSIPPLPNTLARDSESYDNPSPPKNVAPPLPPHSAAPPVPPQNVAPPLPTQDAPNFDGYNMTAVDTEERHHHHHHHHMPSNNDNEYHHSSTVKAAGPSPILTSSTDVMDSIVHVDENKEWYLDNNLPPSLQDQVNKTLIYEVEERKPETRSGIGIIEKDFYILMVVNDKYVQKLVSVRYDENNTDNASFHITNIPVKDEEPSGKYGLELYSLAVKYNGHSIDPSVDFATKLFGKIPSILPNIGLSNFGKLIYANESHQVVKEASSFQPGDIISIYNARFVGHNKLRQKITYDVGVNKPMVAIISEFDPSKQKFRVLEKDSKCKIKPVSYKVTDMQIGTIKVFRPVGRQYVGW